MNSELKVGNNSGAATNFFLSGRPGIETVVRYDTAQNIRPNV